MFDINFERLVRKSSRLLECFSVCCDAGQSSSHTRSALVWPNKGVTRFMSYNQRRRRCNLQTNLHLWRILLNLNQPLATEAQCTTPYSHTRHTRATRSTFHFSARRVMFPLIMMCSLSDAGCCLRGWLWWCRLRNAVSAWPVRAIRFNKY